MIDRRVCTVCKIEKSFDEFGKSKKGKWGIREQCKDCKRIKDRAYEQANPAICTAKHARWAARHPEHLQSYRLERYAEDPERIRRQVKEYRARTQNAAIKAYKKRYPRKQQARRYVDMALLFGDLVRPEKCSQCLIECKPDAHHEDYEKPLQVEWLCRVCHGKRHRKNPRKSTQPERASEKTREGCGALDSMET